MNIEEILSSIKYLQETMDCVDCKAKYKNCDINVIATTNVEGLFEMKCPNCESITIVNVLIEPEIEITRKKRKGIKNTVNSNDVLDLKNFLTGFDGDFKKIFKP